MALYELGHHLKDTTESKKWINIAINRINFEISHAFSSDGGHVENSPVYLNFGLKQVQEALSLGQHYEGENSRIYFSKDILAKATNLLAFITQPNGKLPLIGDTKDFITKDFFDIKRGVSYENFLYSIRGTRAGSKPSSNDLVLKESGWVVFRSSWDTDKFINSLHLVFKCGFLSNYHRHDDDLNFTLFAYGEEWFTDGGEYKHMPKDPYRIYFRSAESHNISMPYGVRAHRNLIKSKETGIKDYTTEEGISNVSAKSYMFDGYINSRTLKYDRNNNNILIHDKCVVLSDTSQSRMKQRVDNKWTTYVTKFLIPKDKRIVVNNENKSIFIYGQKKVLKITTKNFNGRISLVKAKNKPLIRGWISKSSGVLEEAYSLEFYHLSTNLDFEYSIDWEEYSKLIITDKIILKIILKEKIIKIDCFVDNKKKLQGKLKYAFYLMYDNEKNQQIWYQYNNKGTFNLKGLNLNKVMVISFVMDEHGNKIRYSERLIK